VLVLYAPSRAPCHSYLMCIFSSECMACDESFLVAWSYLDDRGIFAQKYDVFGSRFGTQINIKALPNYFKVDISEDGSYVIAWEQEDRISTGAFAQIFDKNSARISIQTPVSGSIDHTLATIYFLNNSTFVADFIVEDDTIAQRAFFINGTLSGETTFEVE
jgi:hypothetical protein